MQAGVVVGPGAGADDRIKLPVYFHWEFSTGLAGDFESLARRLEPKRLPATVGLQPMDVSNPGWGMPKLQATRPGAVLDLGGALQTPETTRGPGRTARGPLSRIASARSSTRRLHRIPPAAGLPSSPRLFTGSGMPKLQAVAAAGPPHWFRELNLDPRHRVAAGLGTAVIRFEQEQLMASAWDQLAKHEQDNQRLQRAQLAETVGEALVDKHFKGLQPDQFLQVTAPAHGTLQRRLAARGLAARAPRLPAGRPVLSSAFRRLTRSGGPMAKRMNRIGAQRSARWAAPNVQRAMGLASSSARALDVPELEVAGHENRRCLRSSIRR